MDFHTNGITFVTFCGIVKTMIRFKRIPENIYQKMSLLNDYFLHDSNVVFAYLFSGMVRDRPSPLSDMGLVDKGKNLNSNPYMEKIFPIPTFFLS
jgi:hypothetical protein